METAVMSGRCSYFPCCFDIPLEVAIQLFSAVDLIYATASMVGWIAIFGLDIFAGRKALKFGYSVEEPFEPPVAVTFIPTQPPSTRRTTKSPFTLRTTTMISPVYDYDSSDTVRLSKSYSKIAIITERSHGHIEQQCGRNYIEQFLFTYALEATKDVFKEFLWMAVISDIFSIIISISMLMTVCCFIEHRSAKVLVMFLWWLNWIPLMLNVYAMILSQSRRLCILQFAWSRKGFKGQSFLFWFLLWPWISYKPYELLVWAFYIRGFLVYGFLTDEHQLPLHARGQSNYQKSYFKEFYQLESERGRNIHDDEEGLSEYEDFDPVEVQDIQDTMDNGKGVDWAQRRQASHSHNFGTLDNRVQMKSIRKI